MLFRNRSTGEPARPAELLNESAELQTGEPVEMRSIGGYTVPAPVLAEIEDAVRLELVDTYKKQFSESTDLMRRSLARDHEDKLYRIKKEMEDAIDDRVTAALKPRQAEMDRQYQESKKGLQEQYNGEQQRRVIAEDAVLGLMRGIFPEPRKFYAPGRMVQLADFPLSDVNFVLSHHGECIESNNESNEAPIRAVLDDGSTAMHSLFRRVPVSGIGAAINGLIDTAILDPLRSARNAALSQKGN